MKNKLSLLALLAMIAVIFTAGCSSAAPVRILVMDGGWDSQRFHNAVAKFIVENGFDGYILETSPGSTALNWQALIAGDVDLDVESWPSNIPTFEADVENGDVILMSTIMEDSAQGFYVPRFVVEGDPERGIEPMAPSLRTVADLINYPHIFRDPEDPSRGRIFGAVPGWLADGILYNKFRYHGLYESFNYLRVGSEIFLFASLASAYNMGEAWIGYAWEPSWAAGRFDLIMLESAPFDPVLFEKGGTEFPRQALKIVASNRFASRAPSLVDFFSRFRTGTQKVSEVLDYLEETNASHEEAAVWFLRNNDSLLDEWLTPEQAGRVRTALSGI